MNKKIKIFICTILCMATFVIGVSASPITVGKKVKRYTNSTYGYFYGQSSGDPDNCHCAASTWADKIEPRLVATVEAEITATGLRSGTPRRADEYNVDSVTAYGECDPVTVSVFGGHELIGNTAYTIYSQAIGCWPK